MLGLVSITLLSVYVSNRSISESISASSLDALVHPRAVGDVMGGGPRKHLSLAAATSLRVLHDHQYLSREALVNVMVAGAPPVEQGGDGAGGPEAPWGVVASNEAKAASEERVALEAEGEDALVELGPASGPPLLFVETGRTLDISGLGIMRALDSVCAAVAAAGGDLRIRLFTRAPLAFGRFYAFSQEYPASWLDRWQRGGWDAAVSVMSYSAVSIEDAAEQRALEHRGISVASKYRKRHATYIDNEMRTLLNRTETPRGVLGASDFFKFDGGVLPNPISRLLTVVAEAQLILELGGGVTDGALRVRDGSLLLADAKSPGVYVSQPDRPVSRGVLAWYPPQHPVPQCVVDIFAGWGDTLLAINVTAAVLEEATAKSQEEPGADPARDAAVQCQHDQHRCLEALLLACHATTGTPNLLDDLLSDPTQSFTETLPLRVLSDWPASAHEADEDGFAPVPGWQHPTRWHEPGTRLPCQPLSGHYTKCAPSFLLLGAEKAGTTYFLTALTSHPQIVRPLTGSLFKEVGLYHRFFIEGKFKEESARWAVAPYIDRERDSLMWGDGFVYYLDDRVAPEHALADNPNLRCMVMLREPAARALSGYRFSHKDYTRRNLTFPLVSRVRMTNLKECLVAKTNDLGINTYHACRMRPSNMYDGHHIVSLGLYAFQLAFWLKSVPRDRLDVYFFDDLIDDPDRVLRRAEVFLGLDTNDANATAAARQNSARPKGLEAAPNDDPEVQAAMDELRAFYAPFNDLLRNELNIELPASWS
jgi:hypothetical protein